LLAAQQEYRLNRLEKQWLIQHVLILNAIARVLDLNKQLPNKQIVANFLFLGGLIFNKRTPKSLLTLTQYIG
jgi:hypothetical protein